MFRYILYLALCLSDVYAKVYFKEEFTDEGWAQRWIASEHPSKDWGKFVLTPGSYYGDPEISKGIQTSQDAKFYGLTTKFEPFSNKGKVLVIQFSVKHEQDIKCGGAYIKLFDCRLKPKNFHAHVPYLIMFGPDICGPQKKVQVIFNYKERNLAMQNAIRCKDDRLTHLYTLVIKPDNTYIIKIDNKIERSGELDDDWNFLPPKQKNNTKVTKPQDWDDNPTIEDPSDTKPDDWEPEYIPDLTDLRPDDWEEEIDGEWKPHMIKNPSYKGEWKPRLIDNPNYKGPWVHPLIDNPEYISDPDLYKYDEICGVGFDLWQVEFGTIFDNILITDDEAEAEKHGEETWGAIKDNEKVMKIKVDIESAKESTSKTKATIKHDEF